MFNTEENIRTYFTIHFGVALITMLVLYVRFLYQKQDLDSHWDISTLRDEMLFRVFLALSLGHIFPLWIFSKSALFKINELLEKSIRKYRNYELSKSKFSRVRLKSNNTLIGKLTLHKNMVYIIIEMVNSKKVILLNNDGSLTEIPMIDLELL